MSDALDAANSYVSQGAALVTNVQKTINAVNPPSSSSSPSAQVASPVLVNSSTPNPGSQQFLFSNPLSTGAKIGIGVGVVGLLGTIVYVVTRKKKKQ